MLLNKNNSLIFLFVFYLGTVSFSTTKDDWLLKKNEKGVTVYTRNSENSVFKELKAVAYLKTSISSIVGLLYDFEKYPEWVYKCGTSGTLKKISEKELIHYQTVIAPWPISNRDFIVNIKIGQDEITKVVSIKSYAKGTYIPVFPNYVRIMNFNASWTLTPQKDGSVEIVYQLLVDPAGAVPAWAMNMAIVDGPFETMNKIKERVFKEEYQKAKIPFIKEPIKILSKN
ncbi:MAG: START domain-containing protein [Bacteroidetes bacterium]|nr:START domain-containing protein [Bacteroidota bacterium]